MGPVNAGVLGPCGWSGRAGVEPFAIRMSGQRLPGSLFGECCGVVGCGCAEERSTEAVPNRSLMEGIPCACSDAMPFLFDCTTVTYGTTAQELARDLMSDASAVCESPENSEKGA